KPAFVTAAAFIIAAAVRSLSFHLVDAVVKGHRYLAGTPLEFTFGVEVRSESGISSFAGIEQVIDAEGDRSVAFKNIFANGQVKEINSFCSSLGGHVGRPVIEPGLKINEIGKGK